MKDDGIIGLLVHVLQYNVKYSTSKIPRSLNMTGFSDYSTPKIPRSVKDDGIFGLLDFENPAVYER